MKQQSLKESLQAFDRSIELTPDNADSWNGRASVLYELGSYQEALAAFEQAIGLDSLYAFPWNGKGSVFYELGNYQQALDAFDRAIELDSNYAYPWNGKASTFYELGRYQEALDGFDRAIQIDPSFVDPWIGKAKTLCDLNRYDDALDAYDRAIHLDVNHADIWNAKGALFYKLKKYRQALDAYGRAQKIDTQNADAWNGKGNVLYEMGFYGDALDAFHVSIECDSKSAFSWYGQGKVLCRMGKYHEALIAFDRAAQLDSENAAPWRGRGQALNGLGRYADALDAFDRAIQFDANDSASLSERGHALLNLGRYQDALENFDRAINLDPNDATCFQGKGRAFFKLGLYPQALKLYNRAIQLDPGYAAPWYGKGIEFFELGMLQEALTAFDHSIELDPHAVDSWFGKANVFYRLMDYASSAQSLAGCYKRCEPTASCTFVPDFISPFDQDEYERNRRLGLIKYYLGFFFQAFELFDKVCLDESKDMMGHYYRTESLRGYAHEATEELRTALNRAVVMLENPHAVDSRQFYYAGLLFCKNDAFELALKCFDESCKDETFMPALYMKMFCAHKNKKRKKKNTLLKEIVQKEELNRQKGVPTFLESRDLSQSDCLFSTWENLLLHHAHQMEISEALAVVSDWMQKYGKRNDMSRYDTWMLPESHKVKPTVSNQAFLKKHVKMLRRGLDTYYSSIPYSDKEHTRQETEEKLAVYIADKGAQLCDEWEKYSIHLLIDYFFYKDILTVRTALLLHMYALLKKLEYKKPSDDAKPSAKHAKEARTPLAPTLIWGDLTLFLHRVVKAVRPGALALLSEYLCKMILEIGKTADCLTYKVLKSGVSEFIGSEFEDDDFGAK